ncbi:MAG TPA: serine/threonine-protein kinase, partial [Longimicrobiales bacterium]
MRTRLEEGTRGEFEVEKELGRGGMGAVYLARERALDRRVAIKVLFPHLMADPTNLERFRHEARIVAALRHPNIVSIHTVRDLGDLHFFVMDFVEGASLKSVIASHGPLPIPVVEALCYQVGSALAYAHRQGSGVIHRDIKPSNIMLDRDGNAIVMDFGLSKALDTSTGLTRSGAVVGTPEYMSPEQGRGDFLTTSSDQYAFGLVAYAMLAGAPPFTGTQFQVLMAHAHHDPAPIAEVRPDCPEPLAAGVEKMLAKSPSGRWPDLVDFLRAVGGRPPAHGDPVLAEAGAMAEAAMDVDAEPEGIVSLTLSNPPSDLRPGDRFV